jgi:hypothetical protein
MRGMWLYALPIALAAFNPASADAAGREQSASASPYAILAPDQGDGGYRDADVLKPHGRGRSEAAEQAARGRAFVAHAPAADDSSPSPDIASPAIDNSGSDAAIEMANQQAALDASTAAAQQQFNDGMAAAQQTMNNANFSQQ